MHLTLHYHPLSSNCHKVLIAARELAVPLELRLLNLGDSRQRADFLALWPTGKMPLLVDGGRVVPETTIIIEHLAQHHAGEGQQLVPTDPHDCLEMRLMERLADLYVMVPMQAIVGDRLRAQADRDPVGVAKARETLAIAYGMLDQRLQGRTWIAGEEFSMADCTAAPALFYATTLVPLAPQHARLAAYFERLVQRPSVAGVLDDARPYFHMYPYAEAIPAGFREPA